MSVHKTKVALFRVMGRRQDFEKSWSVDKTKIAIFRVTGSDEILVHRILQIFAKAQSLKSLVGLDGHGIFTDFTYIPAGGPVANYVLM